MSMKKANWNTWYAAVIALLVLQIIFYYLFTQYWS
jgi:hypothetical protein